MANTFITPDLVARDAAITLANRLKVGNLVNRDREAVFKGQKAGDSIKVTVPPAVTDASEFSGSTSATDQTETEIDLTLEKHFYKRIDLTTKQRSLEIDDFTRTVLTPNIQGIADSIDKYMIRQMQVFRKNLVSTVTNRPDSVSDVTAANKALNDLKLVKSGRVALVDTTVEASLLGLNAFTSADFGQDGPSGLREAMIGRRFGFDFYSDANLGAFDRGDVGGTVLVNGAGTAGDTTLTLDGFTEATGTVEAGAAFTIAGDTTRYVVRKDATLASNATTVTISPALQATAADNAAITFEAAGFENVVYHPNAISAAIVAPDPLAVNSVTRSFNGFSVRVSQDSSLGSLSDQIVIDVLCGARVVQPDGGALWGGDS